MDAHKRISKKVEFVDKYGKTRVQHEVTYIRSEQHEKEMEEVRLGKFSKQPVTRDPTALQLFKNSQQVIITTHLIAKTLTATRIREDSRPYKTLTGGELLADYFDQDGESRTLQEGFTHFPSLYIFFGYVDAPNAYLPYLVAQLVGQRFHNASHVWLFVPSTLEQMSVRYKNEALQDLSYLPVTRLMELSDVQTEVIGPQASAMIKPKAEKADIPKDLKTKIDDDPKFTDKGDGNKWKGKR